ncbi:hypothetical protein, partial [Citrobacter freundii]|uniref:hypothetical protein n=1 Tax=Citrobacter freundii TaxID=546 RepID=UPI001C698EBA
MQGIRAFAQLCRIDTHRQGNLCDFLVRIRLELVLSLVKQTDRNREPLHDLEKFDEIRTLHRQKLCESRAAAFI